MTLVSGAGAALTVRPIDTAGNTTAGSGHSYTLDTVAPAAPVITTTAPAQESASSIDIVGTAEAGSRVSLYNNAILITTTAADGSGNWHVNGIALTDGDDYSFAATATDAAGNTGSASSALVFHDNQTVASVAVAISNAITLAHPTATVTFTFSSAPASFNLVADTTASGGTLSDLQSVNATTYTAAFTGTANTDITTATVNVIAGSWQDSFGNNRAGGSSSNFVVDTVTPTVPAVTRDAAAGATITALAANSIIAATSDPAASLPLTVTAVKGAAGNVGHAVSTTYGTVTLNADGSYTYKETAASASIPNGAAVDNIAFTVSDVNGNSTTSTLSVLVYANGQTLYVGPSGGSVSYTSNTSTVVDGSAGSITISALGNGKAVIVTGDHDTVTGGNGPDVVTDHSDGNITLGNGNNTVTAGAGTHVSLGNGSNTVFGGSNDFISVGSRSKPTGRGL